jgi:hypothetical protein
MATVEVDVPGAAHGDRRDGFPGRASDMDGADWGNDISNSGGQGEVVLDDAAPITDKLRVTAQPTSTTTLTSPSIAAATHHLPPSRRPPNVDHESSMPPPTLPLANGNTPFPRAPMGDHVSADVVAYDGLASCAVSEAETSASQSAIDSSTDALPSLDDATHGTPKKEPRRSSSNANKTRDRSGTKSSDHGGIRRLSASKIQELAASPESLPIATIPDQPLSAGIVDTHRQPMSSQLSATPQEVFDKVENHRSQAFGDTPSGRTLHSIRPSLSTRTVSTPPINRTKSVSQPPAPTSASRRNSFQPSPRPAALNLDTGNINFGPGNSRNAYSEAQGRPDHRDHRDHREHREPRPPSPIPPSIPLPPLSAPTLLQLELAAQRPSPLYIHQSYASDLPYESSAVKFERLKNFLFLPMFLEKTLMFGALACLDAWLWTFTILPMRFCIAFGVLFRWWAYIAAKETRWLIGFVWEGLGRLWERGRRGRGLTRRQSFDGSRSTDGESRSRSRARETLHEGNVNSPPATHCGSQGDLPHRTVSTRTRKGTNGSTRVPPLRMHSRQQNGPFRHRRTKSTPSNLTSFHKADLLQGLVIICSSVALMNLDASRMYHFIRAQSAVKLYVIYNLVEVSLDVTAGAHKIFRVC